MTDFSKLNDRIVKQAYEVSNLVLTDEMKVRLFQNKLDRAKALLESKRKEAVYFQIED